MHKVSGAESPMQHDALRECAGSVRGASMPISDNDNPNPTGQPQGGQPGRQHGLHDPWPIAGVPQHDLVDNSGLTQ